MPYHCIRPLCLSYGSQAFRSFSSSCFVLSVGRRVPFLTSVCLSDRSIGVTVGREKNHTNAAGRYRGQTRHIRETCLESRVESSHVLTLKELHFANFQKHHTRGQFDRIGDDRRRYYRRVCHGSYRLSSGVALLCVVSCVEWRVDGRDRFQSG